jgi:hypothetical protein
MTKLVNKFTLHLSLIAHPIERARQPVRIHVTPVYMPTGGRESYRMELLGYLHTNNRNIIYLGFIIFPSLQIIG